MVLWDPYKGVAKQVIKSKNNWLTACAISPNGLLVCNGGLDNNCRLFVNRNGRYDMVLLPGHKAMISALKFMADTIVGAGVAGWSVGTWRYDVSSSYTPSPRC